MKMPDYKPRIRKGQIWRKLHSEYDMRVIIRNKGKGDNWQTVKMSNRKISHHIRTKDLYLFYVLEGSTGVSQSHNIK